MLQYMHDGRSLRQSRSSVKVGLSDFLTGGLSPHCSPPLSLSCLSLESPAAAAAAAISPLTCLLLGCAVPFVCPLPASARSNPPLNLAIHSTSVVVLTTPLPPPLALDRSIQIRSFPLPFLLHHLHFALSACLVTNPSPSPFPGVACDDDEQEQQISHIIITSKDTIPNPIPSHDPRTAETGRFLHCLVTIHTPALSFLQRV